MTRNDWKLRIDIRKRIIEVRFPPVTMRFCEEQHYFYFLVVALVARKMQILATPEEPCPFVRFNDISQDLWALALASGQSFGSTEKMAKTLYHAWHHRFAPHEDNCKFEASRQLDPTEAKSVQDLFRTRPKRAGLRSEFCLAVSSCDIRVDDPESLLDSLARTQTHTAKSLQSTSPDPSHIPSPPVMGIASPSVGGPTRTYGDSGRPPVEPATNADLAQADGERIVQLREGHRWTHKDLSQACGVPVTMLAHAEKGGRLPLNSLAQIGQALGVSPTDIIGRDVGDVGGFSPPSSLSPLTSDLQTAGQSFPSSVIARGVAMPNPLPHEQSVGGHAPEWAMVVPYRLEFQGLIRNVWGVDKYALASTAKECDMLGWNLCRTWFSDAEFVGALQQRSRPLSMRILLPHRDSSILKQRDNEYQLVFPESTIYRHHDETMRILEKLGLKEYVQFINDLTIFSGIVRFDNRMIFTTYLMLRRGSNCPALLFTEDHAPKLFKSLCKEFDDLWARYKPSGHRKTGRS
jgi:transcriptional regulator with XRE-family HTH domain